MHAGQPHKWYLTWQEYMPRRACDVIAIFCFVLSSNEEYPCGHLAGYLISYFLLDNEELTQVQQKPLLSVRWRYILGYTLNTDLPECLKLWFMDRPIVFFVLLKAQRADKARHNGEIRGMIGHIPETCSA